jgi:hypothetical protein
LTRTVWGEPPRQETDMRSCSEAVIHWNIVEV